MKKIIATISLALLPTVSFAQNYSYRMMGNSYGWQPTPVSGVGIFFVFLIPIIWILFMISMFVFWVMMLIDAIKHAPEKMKIVWVLVIIFASIVGALIYYFVEKRPREKMHAVKKAE